MSHNNSSSSQSPKKKILQKHQKIDNDKKILENALLDRFGGKNSNSLPESLMFDHVSPATRLLERRRQMFEVQEALNSQKEESNRRDDAFRRREDGLNRKDLQLQESFIKFNKFLQENELKRNRALKRLIDERKQRETKENEIKLLEVQLNNKLYEENILKDELENNIKYQEYLENVVQNMSKFFPEISDILNRYKTLQDANAYLLDKQMNDDAEQDLTLKDFMKFQKVKENQILNDSNEIADLQMKLEHKRLDTMSLQDDIDQANTEASEKDLQLGQILSSVTNLLDRCEESFRIRHNKPFSERSTDKTLNMPIAEQSMRAISKLDEIAMFILDFKDLREEYLHEKKMNYTNGGGVSSGAGLGTASVASSDKDFNITASKSVASNKTIGNNLDQTSTSIV